MVCEENKGPKRGNAACQHLHGRHSDLGDLPACEKGYMRHNILLARKKVLLRNSTYLQHKGDAHSVQGGMQSQIHNA